MRRTDGKFLQCRAGLRLPFDLNWGAAAGLAAGNQLFSLDASGYYGQLHYGYYSSPNEYIVHYKTHGIHFMYGGYFQVEQAIVRAQIGVGLTAGIEREDRVKTYLGDTLIYGTATNYLYPSFKASLGYDYYINPKLAFTSEVTFLDPGMFGAFNTPIYAPLLSLEFGVKVGTMKLKKWKADMN